MKKKLFPLLAALLICALLAGCGGAAGSFESHVRNGDYQKAADLYNERIAGNGTLETECESFLTQYMKDSWADYQSGKLTGDKLNGIFRTLSEVCTQTGLYIGLEEYQYMYLMVEDSRENFAQAEQYLKDGKYVEAIRTYDYVMEEDTVNYETAMAHQQEARDAYEKAAIADATETLESGDFTGAVEAIRDAENVVGSSDQLENFIEQAEDTYEAQVLALAQEDLDAEHYADAINTILAAEDALGPTEQLESFIRTAYTGYYMSGIEDCYNAGEYASVRNLYAEASENTYGVVTPEMTSLMGKSQTAYEEKTLAAAAEAFGDAKDYTAAIQVLNTALAEYGETDALVAELARYQSYAPVRLLSLESIRVGSSVNAEPYHELTDVLGNTYERETTVCRCDSAYDDEDSRLYCYLGSAYTTLTGTLYRPSSSLECKTEWTTCGKVEIYGDGVLLYASPDVTMDTYEPIAFSVDVSGVRELQMVFSGVWRKSLEISYHPMVCATNLYLQK